jgi:hypothetical protein
MSIRRLRDVPDRSDVDLLTDKALETNNKNLISLDLALRSLACRFMHISKEDSANFLRAFNPPMQPFVKSDDKCPYEYYGHSTDNIVKYQGLIFAGFEIVYLSHDIYNLEKHKTVGFRCGKPILAPFAYYSTTVFNGVTQLCLNTGYPEYNNTRYDVNAIRSCKPQTIMRNLNVIGSNEHDLLMQIADKCDKDIFERLMFDTVIGDQQITAGADDSVDFSKVIDMNYVSECHVKFCEEQRSKAASVQNRHKQRPFLEVLDATQFSTSAPKSTIELTGVSKMSSAPEMIAGVPEMIVGAPEMIAGVPEMTIAQTEDDSEFSAAVVDVKLNNATKIDPREKLVNDMLDDIPDSGIINHAQLRKFLNALITNFGNAKTLQIISRKGSHVQVKVSDVKQTLVVPHGGRALQKNSIVKFTMNIA